MADANTESYGPGHGPGNSPGHGPGTTIYVDDEPREVRPGNWIVSELKTALGIDPARVLAQITDSGLTDLDDNGRIVIKKSDKLITHGREGAAS
ncbi:MAG: hypothetical protein AB7H70_01765 [Rhodospirillaceae bacterium]